MSPFAASGKAQNELPGVGVQASPASPNGPRNQACDQELSTPIYCVYTVGTGETLSGIANALALTGNHQYTAAELLAASNPDILQDHDALSLGQKLRVPTSNGVVHTVVAGDSLVGLAARYGVHATDILDGTGRPVPDANSLAIGQALLVPQSGPSVASEGTAECKRDSSSFCPYHVQTGDTLSGIAYKAGLGGSAFFTAPELLAASNSDILSDEHTLQVGQMLRVPVSPGIIHIVTPSDTLFDLAGRYGADVTSISGLTVNQLRQPDSLSIGQAVLIPHPTRNRLPVAVAAAPAPSLEKEPPALQSEPAQSLGLLSPQTGGAIQTEVPAASALLPLAEAPVQETRGDSSPSSGSTGEGEAARGSTSLRSNDPSDTSPAPPSSQRRESDDSRRGIQERERSSDQRQAGSGRDTSRPDLNSAANETAEREEARPDTPTEVATQTAPREQEATQLAPLAQAQVATQTSPPVQATPPPSQSGSSARFAWPASGPISSYFGPSHPLGIDIDFFATPNQAVAATAAGTVTFAGGEACCSYGLYVVVDHGNGFTSLYAHLSQINVKVGRKVSQGEVLGLGGRTGNSTGNHLHFEIRSNGSVVDPLKYLP